MMNIQSHEPSHVLQTERLTLRRFTPDDVPLLHDLANDPAVMHYINGGKPVSRAEIEDELLGSILPQYERWHQYGKWAVHETRSGEFLGYLALRPYGNAPTDEPELGWRLHRAAWGKGYATEGARALIDRAFGELGARVVRAETMSVNTRSRRVMEKAGMRHVRTFFAQWDEVIEGTEQGDVVYAITRAEWQAQRAAHRIEETSGDG
jgi:RimJ/RimL family protein N-acetyltransferase